VTNTAYGTLSNGGSGYCKTIKTEKCGGWQTRGTENKQSRVWWMQSIRWNIQNVSAIGYDKKTGWEITVLLVATLSEIRSVCSTENCGFSKLLSYQVNTP